MNLAQITLEGRHVKLEPMGLHHVESLAKAAMDPRIWRFTNVVIGSVEDMRKYVETALSWRSAGTAVPFVTMSRDSHEVIGSTRFANIDWENRRVEIGWTWLNPSRWRSAANSEAKYLMLSHAFEEWKCVRVELKAHSKNERSRTAIARLGAIEEGTLRRHMLQPDGSWRDTVYYSILDNEWPAIKQALRERIERGNTDASAAGSRG